MATMKESYYHRNKERLSEASKKRYQENRDKILSDLKIKYHREHRDRQVERLKSIGLTGAFSSIGERFVSIPIRGKNANGRLLIIDHDDFELVNQYSWSMSSKGYAATRMLHKGKPKYTRAHRVIMGVIDSSDVHVDHANCIKLDCRKSNLRIATNQQNMWNKPKKKSKTGEYSSKYKGVSWHVRDLKWTGYIAKDGKLHHFGYFDSEEEAARAYDKKAKELFGEFANLNFPDAA